MAGRMVSRNNLEAACCDCPSSRKWSISARPGPQTRGDDRDCGRVNNHTHASTQRMQVPQYPSRPAHSRGGRTKETGRALRYPGMLIPRSSIGPSISCDPIRFDYLLLATKNPRSLEDDQEPRKGKKHGGGNGPGVPRPRSTSETWHTRSRPARYRQRKRDDLVAVTVISNKSASSAMSKGSMSNQLVILKMDGEPGSESGTGCGSRQGATLQEGGVDAGTASCARRRRTQSETVFALNRSEWAAVREHAQVARSLQAKVAERSTRDSCLQCLAGGHR